MNFGDLVIITKEDGISFGSAGVFVGLDRNGKYKIYLSEPINKVHLVQVNPENVQLLGALSEKDYLLHKHKEINYRKKKLLKELEKIDKTLIFIEKKINKKVVDKNINVW